MKLIDNIYSVGVVDKNIRIFHGYETPIGTTYNSFLIIDEKVTLVDCVKQTFTNEFLKNIYEILKERPINYVICNHVEPDHSGALPKVIEKYPDAVVYGTAKCQNAWKQNIYL